MKRLAAARPCAIGVSASFPPRSLQTSFHLPEVPSSNDRFAAVRTPEDLVVKTFRAIIVSEVESSIPVLVLDYELDPHVTGPGTHGFQLERSVVAREHAAVAVAGIIYEGAGFLWINEKH